LTFKEITMDYKIGLAAIAILAAVVASNTWASDSTVRAEEALIVQGNKHWEEGRLGDAQKSFEQAVVADPSSIDAHMKLGGLQLSNRSYAVAIRTYQRTISLDRNNAKAWMGLGMAYLHSGQHELSRAAFGEAVRADPSRKAQLAPLLVERAG